MNKEPVIVVVPGRVHPQYLELIKAEWDRKIDNEHSEYVFDMSKVENVYSAVLNLVVHLYKQVVSSNGHSVMININPNVLEALHTLKINMLMPIYDSLLDYQIERELSIAA